MAEKTSIGNYAFEDCAALATVTIENGVTSIGELAFLGCSSLTSVTFEGTMAEWEAVKKGSAWNDDCPFTAVKCSNGNVSV